MSGPVKRWEINLLDNKIEEFTSLYAMFHVDDVRYWKNNGKWWVLCYPCDEFKVIAKRVYFVGTII